MYTLYAYKYVGECMYVNTGEECRSRFSYARTHDAVATVNISRQRRISKFCTQTFRPTDLNLANLKQLDGTAT